MLRLSVRVSAASARNASPVLPALLRGVIFFTGLAAPFVVAHLAS
jgi:hypothetical protein